jgi:hypothetical protein
MSSYFGAEPPISNPGGAPPLPQQGQISPDFAPGTLLNKADAGIGKDQIELWLQSRAHEPKRERSLATNPTLEFSLWNIRAGTREIFGDTEAFEAAYENVVGMLPDDIKEELAQQLAKPLRDRDPDFIALNDALVSTAKEMEWANRASQPFDVNNAGTSGTEKNMELTDKALEGVFTQVGEFSTIRNELLPVLDANDNVSKNLALLQDSIGTLQNILTNRANGKNEEKTQQDLVDLAEHVQSISNDYQNSGKVGDMQILGTLLSSLGLVTAALTLDKPLQPLLIGLAHADIGVDRNSSLNKLSDIISEALGKTFLKDLGIGGQALFPMLAKAALTYSLVGMIIGSGHDERQDEKK